MHRHLSAEGSLPCYLPAVIQVLTFSAFIGNQALISFLSNIIKISFYKFLSYLPFGLPSLTGFLSCVSHRPMQHMQVSWFYILLAFTDFLGPSFVLRGHGAGGLRTRQLTLCPSCRTAAHPAGTQLQCHTQNRGHPFSSDFSQKVYP